MQVQAALVFELEDCCASMRMDNASSASVARADWLNNLGSQLYAAGDYNNAGKALREALQLEESAADAKADSLAKILFNLAAVARMESRLPEAEGLYKRAIAVRESVSGANSTELGPSLAGLALVYMSDGRMTQAIEAAERGVRVSGNGVVANNALATVLLARGDARKAEAIEQQVVDELRRTRATRSAEYVGALTNLGTARYRLANYRQAESDLHEGETTALLVAGGDHPLTAIIWNNLAKVRAAQGDSKGAEALYQKAIAAWSKTLGPAHPDVAYGLSNMASLYQSRKRSADAERLFTQALEIDRAALGAQSLRVANDWNNLGALAALTHHYGDAETKLTRALAIARQKAGEEHPDTAGIAVNLAVAYLSQARYQDASALFAKALPVKERVLGADSPELASILRLYARSLKGSHEFAGAEKVALLATRITTHSALTRSAE
jgi:tetratricopeptide (TPR) repeat protein